MSPSSPSNRYKSDVDFSACLCVPLLAEGLMVITVVFVSVTPVDESEWYDPWHKSRLTTTPVETCRQVGNFVCMLENFDL